MSRSLSQSAAIIVTTVFVATALSLAPSSPSAGSSDRSKYPSEKVVDREFPLKAGGKLTIDVDDMDIYIKESSGGKSRVEVFVAGPDLDRAVEFFNDEMDFHLESKKNDLTMESDVPGSHSSSFWKRYHNVHVWAIVSVPRRMDADISTEDGDLRVDALDGDIVLRTEDGDVELGEFKGSSVDIETEDGDISLKRFKGGDLTLSTEDGDLKAKELRGKEISLASSDGDIIVSRIDADEISVRTSDGDIEIGASGGRLRVDCSDGDMEIEIFSEMAVDLKSDDGDITLRMPSSIGADLNLRGEVVSVRGGAKIQGTISKRQVKGTLNDGGPIVRAKSRDGSIELKLQ